MTRTKVQNTDVLFGRISRYAEIRETSIADVFRSALELFMNVHAPADVVKTPKRWSVPVCRPTGLVADPFAHEDWRALIYENRDE